MFCLRRDLTLSLRGGVRNVCWCGLGSLVTRDVSIPRVVIYWSGRQGSMHSNHNRVSIYNRSSVDRVQFSRPIHASQVSGPDSRCPGMPVQLKWRKQSSWEPKWRSDQSGHLEKLSQTDISTDLKPSMGCWTRITCAAISASTFGGRGCTM